MDLQDLYLPAAVVNLLTAALCLGTAVLADAPWVAAIGIATNLAALGMLVILGELLS